MSKRTKVENGLSRLFSSRKSDNDTDKQKSVASTEQSPGTKPAPSQPEDLEQPPAPPEKMESEDKIKAVTGALVAKKTRTSARKPARKARASAETASGTEVAAEKDIRPEAHLQKPDDEDNGTSSEPVAISTFSSEQIVVFSLGKELYGINIAAVEGIIKMQPITVVPRAPHYIEGVTNLRGSVVPIINLRKRLNQALTEETVDSRIINVRLNSIAAGLIVDSVHSVLQVDGKDISMPSKFISGDDSAFIRAIARVDNQLIILLDLEKVLTVRIAAKKFY